jgi:hypothetical protein
LTATSRQSFPAAIAITAALALFVVAINWGTFAAGGSDSSCYLNQARLFRSGTTHIEQPLVSRAPWPRAEWTFTPAGHVPSAVGRDIIVPMCPPGLPLLMTVAGVVRGGEFLVVPCAGALAVWLTFILGRRLDSPRTGAAAAVLLACSPSVLFQVVQPMTDVAAMAWWLLAAVLAIGWREGQSRPFASGLAAAMAVLTRPNLLPLAAVIGAYVASGFSRTSRANGPPEGGRHVLLRYITGFAPGLALLAVLQWKMYGSPIATGYGPAQDLFKIANILPNLQRYPRWLVETHTPAIAVALAAPLVMQRRAEAFLGLSIAATTLVLYLPYQIFDDWYYVRFLLPALPWLIVLSLIVVDRAVSRVAGARTAAAMAAIAIGVGTLWIATAQQRRAFELAQLERHFVEAGRFAADRLPANAAVLTVRHSGSVQYYSQRPTISWDTLEAGTLDRALEFLREQGLTPFLLLDTAEESTFRQQFDAASPIGRLDWPPLARVGRTIRVYDPADRARYFARASAQPFR